MCIAINNKVLFWQRVLSVRKHRCQGFGALERRDNSHQIWYHQVFYSEGIPFPFLLSAGCPRPQVAACPSFEPPIWHWKSTISSDDIHLIKGWLRGWGDKSKGPHARLGWLQLFYDTAFQVLDTYFSKCLVKVKFSSEYSPQNRDGQVNRYSVYPGGNSLSPVMQPHTPAGGPRVTGTLCLVTEQLHRRVKERCLCGCAGRQESSRWRSSIYWSSDRLNQQPPT